MHICYNEFKGDKMKKTKFLFVFILLLNILCGCELIKPKYTCFTESDFGTNSLCILNSGKDSLIYVDSFDIEEDYYIKSNLIDFPDLYESRKVIILQCNVKIDFGNLMEENSIVRIPMCVSLQSCENLPKIEDVKKWICQLDGLLIKCKKMDSSYYDTDDENINRLINENSKESYMKENLMETIQFSHEEFIGVKNGKVDLNTYKEILNYSGNLYFIYVNDYIYDGASIEELYNHLKLKNDLGYSNCELHEVPFFNRFRGLITFVIGPIFLIILVLIFILIKVLIRKNN